MEFKCPKCDYVLTGTPDECPLCHEPLTYGVKSKNMQSEALAAFSEHSESHGEARSETPELSLDVTPESPRKKKKDRDPRPITGFNIVALIYTILCALFFAFIFLYPMFNTPDGLELAFWGTSAFPRASETTSNALFPFLPGYSFLDYLVYVIQVIMLLMEANGGFDFRIILPFILNALPILFSAIALLILVIGLICNIVYLCTRKLPKYIEKSRLDRFGDPCNVMGLIITTIIFYMLAIFGPTLLSKLPFSLPFVIDDVLGLSVIPMGLLIMAGIFGAIIICAIVKAVFRSKVNPKP